MTFTLKLELAPGTTYAEIQRQVELVASKLPVDSSKPDGPHRIEIDIPGRNVSEDVKGQWNIDRTSQSLSDLLKEALSIRNRDYVAWEEWKQRVQLAVGRHERP